MKKIVLFAFLLVAGNIFSQTEGYAVNNDGSKTYYKTFGKGEPLLIINGGPGMNSNGFEDMAKVLGESQLAIIYDQRGTGKSKLSKLDSKTISMKLMVDGYRIIKKTS